MNRLAGKGVKDARKALGQCEYAMPCGGVDAAATEKYIGSATVAAAYKAAMGEAYTQINHQAATHRAPP